MRRLGWWIAFVCVLFAMATSAGAAPSPAELESARKLFAEAEADEKAERWEHALATLQKVAAIKETPGVRFHIGNCFDHLGRLLEALDSFQRALSLAEAKRAREVTELALPRIDALKARIPTLKLVVQGSGPQPRVTIDAKPIEPSLIGTAMQLDPGTHSVRAEFEDAAPVVKEISLQEGKSESLLLSPPLKAPSASSRPVASVTPAPEPSASQGSGRVPFGAWVLMGAGVGLGVGGFLSFQHAGAVADDSKAACARSVGCDPDRAAVVHRYDALSLGLWSAAAVSLGAGVLWALTSHRSPARASVGLGPDRVTLQGAF